MSPPQIGLSHQGPNQPNQPPCKKPTAKTSSSQKTYWPRNSTSKQPTSPGTSYYFILFAAGAIVIHLEGPHFHALDVLSSMILGCSFRKKKLFKPIKNEGNVPASHVCACVYLFLSQCLCFAGAMCFISLLFLGKQNPPSTFEIQKSNC